MFKPLRSVAQPLGRMPVLPWWGHAAVLSEEGAFPAVELPGTRHPLPCQRKWALLSPYSEPEGIPNSLNSATQKKAHTFYDLNPPQILPFGQDQKWKAFLHSHFRKKTTTLIKFLKPDACSLLILFAFSLSDCIKQLKNTKHWDPTLNFMQTSWCTCTEYAKSNCVT